MSLFVACCVVAMVMLLARSRGSASTSFQNLAPPWIASELQLMINAAFAALSMWPGAFETGDGGTISRTLPSLRELHAFLDSRDTGLGAYELLGDAEVSLLAASQRYIEAADAFRRGSHEIAGDRWEEGSNDWAEAQRLWPRSWPRGVAQISLPGVFRPIVFAERVADLPSPAPGRRAGQGAHRRSSLPRPNGRPSATEPTRRPGNKSDPTAFPRSAPWLSSLSALEKRRAYRVAKRHGWDRAALTRRANAAYARTGVPGSRVVPATAAVAASGRLYVLVSDASSVLAVYRVLESGILKRLRKWPYELAVYEPPSERDR